MFCKPHQSASPTHWGTALLARPLLARISMKNKQKKLMALGLGALLLMMFPRVLYSYEEVIVKDGATIRGAVKVEGALPKLPASSDYKI